EVPTCDACGQVLEHGTCVPCLERHVRDEMLAWLRTPELPEPRVEPEDELDPLERVDAGETLADQLLSELMTVLAPSERRLAELLIGSLDERGYLNTSLDEIAYLADVPVERCQHILRHLQRLEPIGW